MRILIFGNSGSGKTWLANNIAERTQIPVIHFDQHFWEPGGFNRKRDKKIVFQEIEEISLRKDWIMEGVFGELAEIALPRATAVIFLDKTWDECREALQARGSESAKQLDPVAAEKSFRELLTWAENYWLRKDLRSREGHLHLFNSASCNTVKITSRAEAAELLEQNF